MQIFVQAFIETHTGMRTGICIGMRAGMRAAPPRMITSGEDGGGHMPPLVIWMVAVQGLEER